MCTTLHKGESAQIHVFCGVGGQCRRGQQCLPAPTSHASARPCGCLCLVAMGGSRRGPATRGRRRPQRRRRPAAGSCGVQPCCAPVVSWCGSGLAAAGAVGTADICANDWKRLRRGPASPCWPGLAASASLPPSAWNRQAAELTAAAAGGRPAGCVTPRAAQACPCRARTPTPLQPARQPAVPSLPFPPPCPSCAGGKTPLHWSPALHTRFVDAVKQLGAPAPRSAWLLPAPAAHAVPPPQGNLRACGCPAGHTVWPAAGRCMEACSTPRPYPAPIVLQAARCWPRPSAFRP